MQCDETIFFVIILLPPFENQILLSGNYIRAVHMFKYSRLKIMLAFGDLVKLRVRHLYH
jgi:hypothetical protein